jgi:lipopolysaccharide export LptBFGC system permease protein LptF
MTGTTVTYNPLDPPKPKGFMGVPLPILIGIGIFIIIFYLFVSKYFISMGSTNLIHPLVAVWITNVIFAAIGMVLYRFAQK